MVDNLYTPLSIFVHDVHDGFRVNEMTCLHPYDEFIRLNFNHLIDDFDIYVRKGNSPFDHVCGFDFIKEGTCMSIRLDLNSFEHLLLTDMSLQNVNTICSEPQFIYSESDDYINLADANVFEDYPILRNIIQLNEETTNVGDSSSEESFTDDFEPESTLYSMISVSKSWFIIQLKHKKFSNSEIYNYAKDFWKLSIQEHKRISNQILDLLNRKNISVSDAKLFYTFFAGRTYGFKICATVRKYVMEQKMSFDFQSECAGADDNGVNFCNCMEPDDTEIYPEFLGLSMPTFKVDHNITLPPAVVDAVESLSSLIPSTSTGAENEAPSILNKLLAVGYIGISTFYVAKTQSLEAFFVVVSQQVASYYAQRHNIFSGAGEILTKLTGCGHMTLDKIKHALTWVYQWINGEVSFNQLGVLNDEIQPENSLEDIVGDISENNPLFALFGMVWSWMPFSSPEFSKKGDDYAKRFVNFMKGLQGLKTAFEIFPKIIEWVVCHVLAWWQGTTYEDVVLARTYGEKYKRTLTEARNIIARFEEDNLVASPAISLEIQRLWEECTAMNTDLKTKVSAPVQKTLSFITRQLESLKNVAGCHRSTSRQKPEPVSIWLIGPPKKGKSHLYKDLMRDVFALLNFPKFTDVDVFTRNPSDQYWENYCGQRVCLFDDWGSIKSQDLWEEMIGDMIKVINCAPSPLPMAALEKKANTFFSSPFCIYTSNKGFTHDMEKSAADVGAVLRRRHFVIHVDLEPSSRLENDAIPQIDKSRWKLTLKQSNTVDSQDVSGTPVTYEKLVTMIASRYLEHYAAFMINERRLQQQVNVEEIKNRVPENLLRYFEVLRERVDALVRDIPAEDTNQTQPENLRNVFMSTDNLDELDDIPIISDLSAYITISANNYWTAVSSYFSACSELVRNKIQSFIETISCLNDQDFSDTLNNMKEFLRDKTSRIRAIIGVAVLHVVGLRQNIDVHFQNRPIVDIPSLKVKLTNMLNTWSTFIQKNCGPVALSIFGIIALTGFVMRERTKVPDEESTLPRDRRDFGLRQARKTQAIRRGGTTVHMVAPAWKKGRKGPGGGRISEQSGGDVQKCHITKSATAVANNNMAIIWCAHIRNQMIFVGGRNAITTRHTLENMMPYSQDHMVSVIGTGDRRQKLIWSGPLSKLVIRYHPTKDIAMIIFPNHVCEFPNIVKFFPHSEEEVSQNSAWLAGISSAVMDYDYDRSLREVFSTQLIDLPSITYRKQAKYPMSRLVNGEMTKTMYDPGVCLEYPKYTQKGDCGKIIVQAVTNGTQMKSLGFIKQLVQLRVSDQWYFRRIYGF
jgi:hypothetical protein